MTRNLKRLHNKTALSQTTVILCTQTHGSLQKVHGVCLSPSRVPLAFQQRGLERICCPLVLASQTSRDHLLINLNVKSAETIETATNPNHPGPCLLPLTSSSPSLSLTLPIPLSFFLYSSGCGNGRGAQMSKVNSEYSILNEIYVNSRKGVKHWTVAAVYSSSKLAGE